MVNTKIVSRYDKDFPGEGASRKITTGKLYGDVLACVNPLRAMGWTQDCKDDLLYLSFDNDDLSELIKEAVTSGRYKGSEWCQQKINGPWAACDVYTLNRREWSDTAHSYLQCCYYVKFCISKTGTILLVASCHLST